MNIKCFNFDAEDPLSDIHTDNNNNIHDKIDNNNSMNYLV